MDMGLVGFDCKSCAEMGEIPTIPCLLLGFRACDEHVIHGCWRGAGWTAVVELAKECLVAAGITSSQKVVLWSRGFGHLATRRSLSLLGPIVLSPAAMRLFCESQDNRLQHLRCPM